MLVFAQKRSSSLSLRFGFPILLVLSMCTVFLVSSNVAGQTITGAISGTVTDPNGANVPGAIVTLTNDQTHDKRDQPTNDSGRFSFASVQPGVYTLRVEHAGFETLMRTKVVLSANENLALGDLSLKTGQVTETVTIASEGQIVEKESSDLTARLTSDQINLISTKGRDVTSSRASGRARPLSRSMVSTPVSRAAVIF